MLDNLLESLGTSLESVGAMLSMEGGYFWVLLGLVLVILESFGAALALASLGVGAILTGLVAFCGLLNLYGLLVVFAVVSLILFAVSRPLANKLTASNGSTETNVRGLIGRTALVVRDVAGPHRPGYVKVDGDEWRAVSVGDVALGTGATVYITDVQGATLSVDTKPLEQEDTK